MKRALLWVDIQRDFLPGGPLGVPHGDEVVPVANRLAREGNYEMVIATQDWHPPNHLSFASQHPGKKPFEVIELDGMLQTLWPDHCIQGSDGAELAPGLESALISARIYKGTDRHIDSYSAFFDNARKKQTGLEALLRERGITHLDVVGLATDYCVRATVLDALSLGFGVRVIVDGVRAVNLKEGDGERALFEMKEKGAELVSLGG
ncbi:MAG: bifunctional nicotinamidase/pyrazinamidase [Sandaracinaceae bacterium]|nr:bifunctional nicotinamidase/pyrazinamidase [Sandaracinaceae bacterium]